MNNNQFILLPWDDIIIKADNIQNVRMFESRRSLYYICNNWHDSERFTGEPPIYAVEVEYYSGDKLMRTSKDFPTKEDAKKAFMEIYLRLNGNIIAKQYHE